MGRGDTKGGRPPKIDVNKLSKQLCIYVTQEESNRIHSYSIKNSTLTLSRSEFLRRLILKTIQNQEINKQGKTIIALNKIRTHLYQVVKNTKSSDIISKGDVSKLDRCLQELSEVIARF